MRHESFNYRLTQTQSMIDKKIFSAVGSVDSVIFFDQKLLG
jgi:hypothetical protein